MTMELIYNENRTTQWLSSRNSDAGVLLKAEENLFFKNSDDLFTCTFVTRAKFSLSNWPEEQLTKNVSWKYFMN